jgi:hypothetical protein
MEWKGGRGEVRATGSDERKPEFGGWMVEKDRRRKGEGEGVCVRESVCVRERECVCVSERERVCVCE